MKESSGCGGVQDLRTGRLLGQDNHEFIPFLRAGLIIWGYSDDVDLGDSAHGGGSRRVFT